MATTTVNYEGGKALAAGWISTDQVPLAADTYYHGMLLEYNATTDVYEALASGTLGAIYSGEQRTLASAGVGSVVVAGEIVEGQLVDASGASITLTEDQRAAFRDAGFYMKRT